MAMDIGLKKMDSCELENLLKEKLPYALPYFQRDYSWTKDEWSELLDDIFESYKTKEQHFFGFMSFMEEANTTVIIEGQQRISTATIFISVVRDMLYSINDTSYSDIEKAYIKVVDPLNPDNEQFLKLKLSGKNQEYFRHVIQRVDMPQSKIEDYQLKEKKINKSNKLISAAYKFFFDELSESLKKETSQTDYLRSLLSILLRKFIVVRTYVSDEIAAYNVFQTLNNRGLDLALSDLLKIYLLKNTSSKQEEAKALWDQIKENLSFVNSNSFFKHYWLSKYGIIKEADVLTEIGLKFKTSQQTFELLENLKIESEVYEALIKPSNEFWNSEKTVELLEEVQRLTNQSALPILLAIMQEFTSDSERHKCLEMVISHIFRYLNIAEAENKRLERLFSEAAIEIRSKVIKHSDQLRAKLKKENIHDELFIELFKSKEVRKNALARYILEKIEKHINPNPEQKLGKLTLEHIIPINPNQEWKEYLKQEKIEKEDWNYRIGNLTLASSSTNKKLESKFFTNKFLELKHNSKLEINQYFHDKISWNGDDISVRQ